MPKLRNSSRGSGSAAAVSRRTGKPERLGRTVARAGGRKGPRKLLDGQRFDRLIVLSLQGRDKRGAYLWLCQCDCGNTTCATTGRLNFGHTRSCGCLQRERASQAKFKHGLSNSRLQIVWSGMKARCYYPPHKQFSDYGGRGITVCERWRNSFVNFFADMGECPKGMSIERIDNNGNYEPGNCRWATQREQCANTRRTRNLTFRGETMCVSAWARRLGFPRPCAIISRLNNNWPIDKALTTPVKMKRPARARSTGAI